jgi:hypothetical protein
MIALYPIPGFVTQKLQRVQEERLKRTDARVQTVTEGEENHLVLSFSNQFSFSNERAQNDQTFRLGKQDARQDC